MQRVFCTFWVCVFHDGLNFFTKLRKFCLLWSDCRRKHYRLFEVWRTLTSTFQPTRNKFVAHRHLPHSHTCTSTSCWVLTTYFYHTFFSHLWCKALIESLYIQYITVQQWYMKFCSLGTKCLGLIDCVALRHWSHFNKLWLLIHRPFNKDIWPRFLHLMLVNQTVCSDQCTEDVSAQTPIK